MNRTILTLATLLALFSITVMADSGSGEGYDPTNPGDPGERYYLRVETAPAQTGGIGGSGYYDKGRSVTLSAPDRSSSYYYFEEWREGTTLLSTEREFTYTMPDHNAVVTAWYRYDPQFDPSNPPDPESGYHWVKVYSTPSFAGSTTERYFRLREGETKEIHAYPSQGCSFTGWEVDGTYVLPEVDGTPVNPLTVTMGTADMECIAHFAFDPDSPADPATNNFDSATGLLVVDYFTPGSLSSTIRDILAEESRKRKEEFSLADITYVIVMGRMDGDDYRFASGMTDCVTIDLIRTTGLTTLREAILPASVVNLLLPADLTEIEDDVFYGLSNLSTIHCAAVTPPRYNYQSFSGISKPVVAYVPDGSMKLYKEANGWKGLNVIPEGSEECTITLKLPEERLTELKDMALVLESPRSGQSQRFVVNSRTDYTFSNLIESTDALRYGYRLRLLNGLGEELASEVDYVDATGAPLNGADGKPLPTVTSQIELRDGNLTPTFMFHHIAELNDLTLTVEMPDGKDVTAECSLAWKDNAGTYLASGAMLTKVIEGKKATVEVTLPKDLALGYRTPEPMAYVSGERPEDAEPDAAPVNDKKIILEPFEIKTFSGTVTDMSVVNPDGFLMPVKDATVTVTQKILDKYSVSHNAVTDEAGRYTIEYLADDAFKGDITCRADGYVTQSRAVEGFGNLASPVDFRIKQITGALISTEILWKATGAEKAIPYPDSESANLLFTVADINGKEMRSSTQWPDIVVLDETTAGQTVKVTVTGQREDFAPRTAEVTIKSDPEADMPAVKPEDRLTGSLEMTLTEHGAIEVSITNEPENDENGNPIGLTALLYDGNGLLVKRMLFTDNRTSFTNLPAGNYTVVAMRDSRYFNGVNRLGDYGARYGFKKGEHYAAVEATVCDGETTAADTGNVPLFDEEDFYYIQVRQLDMNKTTVTASNYITARACVTANTGRGTVSDLKLRFELPDHVDYVANTLLIGSEPGNPQTDLSEDGRTLVINGNIDYRLLRFCLMPRKGGEFLVSVFADFTFTGKAAGDGSETEKVNLSQPLGTLRFKAEDFTIVAPARTCHDYVYARGVATPMSDMSIFANGVPAGSAVTIADGSWVGRVTLAKQPAVEGTDSRPMTIQQLWGELRSDNGDFNTASKIVTYDPCYPELVDVRMIHSGQTAIFRHTSVATSCKSYSYTPDNDMFSLSATFDENRERIVGLNFHILHSDGTERVIEGVYAPSIDKWIAALGYADSYRLPVNVSYDVTYIVPGEPDEDGTPGDAVLSTFFMGYVAPDVTPIIDPAGFVYEGVPANRLEGVKATIFYREGVDNPLTGAIEWVERKWDAEEYAQENPLFTDAEGAYAWDVPAGQWRVMFEKEGYETAWSEWLPVPPPQLEVNQEMRRVTPPSVASANAYDSENGVEIIFDSYMDASTLTTDNITLIDASDNPIAGIVKAIDSHAAASDSPETATATENPDEALKTADVALFIPVVSLSGNVKLMVKGDVATCSGVPMSQPYGQELALSQKITSITAQNVSELEMGKSVTIPVNAAPGAAATGRTLVVTTDSPDLLEVAEGPYTFDANGQAEISLTALMNGEATLTFSIEGRREKGSAKVKIVPEKLTLDKPVYNIAPGEVYTGTEVTLSSPSRFIIRYTLDGNMPSLTDGAIFDAPLVITADTKIKAVCISGNRVSDVLDLEYKPKKSATTALTLHGSGEGARGWSWISHNILGNVDVNTTMKPVEAISRILSQEQEAIRDGDALVGTLTELEPGIAYKVQASESSVPVSGTAVNPSSPIHLEQGWNWIGFTVEKDMTVSDALRDATEQGDYIVGQEGFATFDGETWTGTLATMQPGQGYLYRSASEKDLVFNTTESTAGMPANIACSSTAPWTPDRYTFPSVMPVIADVILPDGTIAGRGDVEVGAFHGSECRGTGVFIDGTLMMSVYGTAGDGISFSVIDRHSGLTYDITGSTTFADDALGSLYSPFVLDMRKSGVAETDGRRADIHIEGNILHAPGAEVLMMFDTDGRKVMSRCGDLSGGVPIDGIGPGIYIVAVESADGWRYAKIVI